MVDAPQYDLEDNSDGYDSNEGKDPRQSLIRIELRPRDNKYGDTDCEPDQVEMNSTPSIIQVNSRFHFYRA